MTSNRARNIKITRVSGGGGHTQGRALSRREKATIIKGVGEGMVKEPVIGGTQEDGFEVVDHPINAFIRFPELRTES